MKILRILILFLGLIGLWTSIVFIFKLPDFIFPSPMKVFYAWFNNKNLILRESILTINETLLGLLLGSLLGCIAAVAMCFFRQVKFWLKPILVLSQAMPTFAIAPILVIWFGYGTASKIATTMIMLFFPVASAFYDGLQRSDPEWLNLAKTMQASTWRIFLYIRIPAALPALASGFRVATAIAPIGAVIGEWVGASHGLGFLMLNSNARMQIDLMFASLFTLIIFSLSLFYIVDKSLKWLVPWEIKND